MGVRILSDAKQGLACLFDSVSDTAFGPVVYGDGVEDSPQDLLRTFVREVEEVDGDVRQLSSAALDDHWMAFAKEHQTDGGEIRLTQEERNALRPDGYD